MAEAVAGVHSPAEYGLRLLRPRQGRRPRFEVPQGRPRGLICSLFN